MSFNQGDQVVHPAYGVGVVEGIHGMDFRSGQPRDYYRVEFPNTTLWVSLAEQSKSALRLITPKDELSHFRSLLRSLPGQRQDNFRMRHQELETRVSSGTFGALCELVRDLQAWGLLKPLNDYERSLLKRSRNFLIAEWSIVSEMEEVDALDEIDRCLLKSRQLSLPD